MFSIPSIAGIVAAILGGVFAFAFYLGRTLIKRKYEAGESEAKFKVEKDARKAQEEVAKRKEETLKRVEEVHDAAKKMDSDEFAAFAQRVLNKIFRPNSK